MDLQFGIWDLGFEISSKETRGLRAGAVGVLQRGCLHNGDYATRAVKLGFRKIGPPNGETGLQMGNSDKKGDAAHFSWGLTFFGRPGSRSVCVR